MTPDQPPPAGAPSGPNADPAGIPTPARTEDVGRESPAATPPQPQATPWWQRSPRLLAVIAVMVLVAGLMAAAVIAFVAFHSPGDRLTALTPDDADLYATVLLDPSLSQKVHINTLAHKFPKAQSGDPNKQLDTTLQDAFKDSGLSFRNDVKPWLGHQVSIAGRTRGTLDRAPAIALLVDTGDEGRAASALDKFRASSPGRRYQWRQSSHGGVTVWSGTPDTSTSDGAGSVSAYAVLDHMAVLGNDKDFLDEVIDTAQGKHGNLAASGAYRQAMSRLPAEYVVSGYVDARPIVRSLKASFSGLGPSGSGGGVDPTKSLDAYRGAAMTLSAGDNEVLADIDVEIDRSKLDGDTRAALDQPSHINATLGAVPANAIGFLGVGGLKQTATTLLKQYSSDPQARDLVQQLGLDGPGGFVNHLSGDYGLEVTPGAGSVPAGAVLIGVDDSGVAQTFLDRLAAFVLSGGGSAATTAADAGPPPAPAPEDYRGVSVTSLGPPSADAPFSPAYAVLGKVAVVGSTTAAVHAVIDAAKTGPSLATTPSYTTALAGRTSNNGEAFLDIAAIADAIRGSLSGQERTDFDSQAAPNLRPLRTLTYTTVNHPDHVSGRISLLMR